MNPIRDTIEQTVQEILADRGTSSRRISEGDTLTGTLGLDSLDLAVLVVKLEQELGCDPFRDGLAPVSTFGDLVAVYQQCCKENC